MSEQNEVPGSFINYGAGILTDAELRLQYDTLLTKAKAAEIRWRDENYELSSEVRQMQNRINALIDHLIL